MRFLWIIILKETWQKLSNLNSEIRRGDLYYADLSPVVGSEQGGVRPVLIIQNNIGNKYSPTVIVAAITSQINKAKLPTHIEIAANEYGLNKDSVILLEQIRTIDKKRLREKIGCLDKSMMLKIDNSLQISLGLFNI
ncbi:type II toxin-antitoxin system PemK/MazF family toxin [Intestinibacter sp.]|uniref:type II toxin-antitoxin system PemK/MazF family toxin n=1 Tax=Intestinibacter sp. TaxID=1965304 RepID=UPI002A804B54|nr:type II toxin-antitoxin system PemK/MazF family toxin [Intestinibacter sp.]MDY4574972.1 type II toxin-antitoxin system PemK/MazF family toxin [Intestinibacter sp.]